MSQILKISISTIPGDIINFSFSSIANFKFLVLINKVVQKNSVAEIFTYSDNPFGNGRDRAWPPFFEKMVFPEFFFMPRKNYQTYFDDIFTSDKLSQDLHFGISKLSIW